MARPREFDEETVVRAARERFWDAGYAATSMTDLSEATGLGKTSLYGAFGDKHALFMRIFDEYSTGAVQSAGRAREGADAGAFERIRAYLLANARGSAGNPRGCLLARGTRRAGGRRRGRRRARPARLRGARAPSSRAPSRPPSARGTSTRRPTPRALGDLILAVHRGTEALGRGGAERARAARRWSRPRSPVSPGNNTGPRVVRISVRLVRAKGSALVRTQRDLAAKLPTDLETARPEPAIAPVPRNTRTRWPRWIPASPPGC